MLFLLNVNNVYAVKPQIYSQASVLMERDSGRILYAHNSNKKLPMASTTKIMTALLALEHGNLDDIVTITKKSVGVEGSSIYLYEGEKITLKDLVYGLLLRSGNDSAIAIAEYIAGSTSDFVVMMNKRAAEIGAINTNFTNPHGLSNDNHYTTAYDLALITRIALKNETFKEIVKTKVWIADRKKNEYFYNKNKTLLQYEGGDGVKIGYTKISGRCLVASATRDNMQLIAVVLNDSNWFNDCYKLFDYGFDQYYSQIIFEKNQFVKNIYIENGKEEIVPVVTKDRLTIPLKEDEKNDIKKVVRIFDNIQAPLNNEETVGYIEMFVNGKLIHKEELVTKYAVKEKNRIDYILEYIKNIFN